MISPTGLDPDHRQHHQLTPPSILSRPNSTDGDLLSSPHSKRDRDGDGENCEVSCLVTGLYTRFPAFGSARGWMHVGAGG